MMISNTRFFRKLDLAKIYEVDIYALTQCALKLFLL
jgi:hypothetical protein